MCSFRATTVEAPGLELGTLGSVRTANHCSPNDAVEEEYALTSKRIGCSRWGRGGDPASACDARDLMARAARARTWGELPSVDEIRVTGWGGRP